MKRKFTYKDCISSGLFIGVITIVVATIFPAALPSNPCTVGKVLTFSCFHGGRGHIAMAVSYVLVSSGLVWGIALFLKKFTSKGGNNGK